MFTIARMRRRTNRTVATIDAMRRVEDGTSGCGLSVAEAEAVDVLVGEAGRGAIVRVEVWRVPMVVMVGKLADSDVSVSATKWK